MKSIFTFYSIFLFACSCQKQIDPLICNVKDPLTQLEWLRKITDDNEKNQQYETIGCARGIWQATFQDKTVFVIGVNSVGNIICDGEYIVYTCEGDTLGVLGSKDVLTVENRTLIWSSR